ncbi:hypothetical protein HDU88_000874, partial [Geranomyces variabilis]
MTSVSKQYEAYSSYISERDRKYFSTYDPDDQKMVLEEAKNLCHGVQHVVTAYESRIVGIAVADKDGVIIDANSKCLGLLRKSKRDLQEGRVTRLDFATDDINENSAVMLSDVYEKNKIVSYAKTVLNDDGQETVLHIEVRFIQSAGQTVTYLIDETSSRSAVRDEAGKERDMFEQLANSVPFIIWTASPNGNVDYYNDRWYEYTNKWHLIRATPYADHNGKLMRWYGTCVDIHDYKIALLRSEFAETQFNNLLKNLPIAAWGCDTDWICNMSKGKALGAAGLRDDEIVGIDMREYTKKDPDLASYIERALSGEDFGI